tara:strand:+ start:264 stop:740 length:477 start_codon:yes stop_codon:yes gene_type:complete
MSYIRQKKVLFNKENSPATQTISDSYTEITGSRAEILSFNSSAKFVYRFCFNIAPNTSADKWFLHVKLQKSNDNFSSDINDISGANYNVASDFTSAIDHLYRLNTAFFVIDNLIGTNQVRLVCRAYSNSYKPQLHTVDYFDGIASSKILDPSLVIFEV